MDQDYVSKLNDKEKEWLSKFNEEFYGNVLSPKTKRSKKGRKEIFDQTNARNRDIYNVGLKSYMDSGFRGTTGDEDSTLDYVQASKDVASGKLIIPTGDDNE